jgi:hypothetical protein
MHIAVGISLLSCIETEIQVHPVLAAAILKFSIPVSRKSIANSVTEFLDPENMRIAVGNSSLSCLETEIQVFPVWQPPSRISDFRISDGAFSISPLSFPTPKTWG